MRYKNTDAVAIKEERDLVEITRCKDCKSAYINAFSAQSGVAVCRFWTNQAEGNTIVVQQDDFCSHGERREK